MKVVHRLDTTNLKGISEEARWAEEMGYDGLSSNETAHDPFFPLLLAATSTSHVTLKTQVAIAFLILMSCRCYENIPHPSPYPRGRGVALRLSQGDHSTRLG